MSRYRKPWEYGGIIILIGLALVPVILWLDSLSDYDTRVKNSGGSYNYNRDYGHGH